MLNRAGALLAALLLLSSISLGQDGHFDFGLNAAAVFTNQSGGFGVTQSATDGGGGFGTIGVRFHAKHSLVFNYGRMKNSQVYQAGNNFHILTDISEITGAYVFSPFRKGRFEPFVLAGGGALRFYPRSTWVVLPPLANNVPNNIEINLNAARQTQLAFLYGFGVDYRLPVISRLALRLQYRGFLYKAPDFKIDASSGSAVSLFTGAKGHMAEPSLGLAFRF